jgi:hypothetical protein
LVQPELSETAEQYDCGRIDSDGQLKRFQKFGKSVYDSDSSENDAYRTQ